MTPQKRDELLIRIDERQTAMLATLNTVEAEVKKTNGRVTELEKDKIDPERVDSIERWQNQVKGSIWTTIKVIGVIGFIITIIATIYIAK